MSKSFPSKNIHDPEYLPAQQSQKLIKRNRKSSYANRVFNSSKWTFKENEQFLNFIILHKEILICPQKRKDARIFLKLSRTMNSRTPDQCRSHHQKMIKHHQNIDGIIVHLQQRLYNMSPQSQQDSFQQKEQINEKEGQSNFALNSLKTSHELGLSPKYDMQENIWEVVNWQTWLNEESMSVEGLNDLQALQVEL